MTIDDLVIVGLLVVYIGVMYLLLQENLNGHYNEYDE